MRGILEKLGSLMLGQKWNRPGYFIPPTLAEEMRFKYRQLVAKEIESEIVEIDEGD